MHTINAAGGWLSRHEIMAVELDCTMSGRYVIDGVKLPEVRAPVSVPVASGKLAQSIPALSHINCRAAIAPAPFISPRASNWKQKSIQTEALMMLALLALLWERITRGRPAARRATRRRTP